MASTSIDAIAKILETSAKIVEDELDAELNQLKQLDEDDLERLRERRLEALRKAQKRKQVCWLLCFSANQFYFYKMTEKDKAVKMRQNDKFSKQWKWLIFRFVIL